MARQTAFSIDPVRTDRLAIDELQVQKGIGDEDHFFARPADELPECCPWCGGRKLKVQNRFSRTYTDCIPESVPRIVSLTYEFHKYRCLNPGCRHIFSADISFASVNDNVTRRLENRIADAVIGGGSYEAVCAAFQEKLSRQAVGQIFNRWVQNRNEARRIPEAPAVLAVLTGHTNKDEYVLILSCDAGIRILDILYGIDSGSIIRSLKRFRAGNAECILTDCNPTVHDAVSEACPGIPHIVPAEMWLKLVRSDFRDFAEEKLHWVTVRGKLQLVLEPKVNDEANMSMELKRIFDARPELKEPYNDYHYLRSAIANRDFRWSIEELDEWPDSVDASFRRQLSATLVQYREYRPEIAAQQEHWDWVPENLLSATDRLDELIRARRTFSEESLQAAVLWSTGADPAAWQGIPIEDAIQRLTALQEGSRRKNDEHE